MGTDQSLIVISCNVSRHNSARDGRDDALVDLLEAEIRVILEQRFPEDFSSNVDINRG